MTEIIRMRSAEPVLTGVVKIVWRDGYEAVVDLRPVLAQGDIFAFLRDNPSRFSTLALDPHGHTLFWIDDDGDEVDLGTDALRRRAERQAELLRLAS